jgi:hypothetical protein
MSASGSADLQNSTTARFASQTDQPAEPIVLPAFPDKLIADEKLKLTNENFRQLIKSSFNTNITHFSQAQPMFIVQVLKIVMVL